jgi:hypothetical protein
MASILKVTEITTPDGTGNITVSRPLTGGTGVKGGDIASASPLVIDTDGDYFDVTGTTNFAAMTVAADRQFTLQFDGALTMTHHATNLDLPGEANITTAAGDVATFQSTGANTVQCISYVKADGTAVVDSVEGTAVLSTGEAGGTKFLREDSDGTCSWQTPSGGGNTNIFLVPDSLVDTSNGPIPSSGGMGRHFSLMPDAENSWCFFSWEPPSNFASLDALELIWSVSGNNASRVTRLSIASRSVAEDESSEGGSTDNIAEASYSASSTNRGDTHSDMTAAINALTITAGDNVGFELKRFGAAAEDTISGTIKPYGLRLTISTT